MKKLFSLACILLLASNIAIAQNKTYDDANTTYNADGHGSHYTMEDFNSQVETAYKAWLADEEAEGATLSEAQKHSAKTNLANNVYKRFNPNAPEEMLIKFSQNYISALKGMATDSQIKAVDPNDPLLKPISGISLYDYATIIAKSQSGDFNKLLAAFKLNMQSWQTVNVAWAKRMKDDTSYKLIKLYSQYMGEADNNPKLAAFKPAVSPLTAATLKKLDEDYFFAVELSTAGSVAAQNGADANAWLKTKFGVSLAEVMAKYAKHQQNRVINTEEQTKLGNAMAEYQAKYQQMFAK